VFEDGETIMKYGDHGTKFYVIIKGRASFSVPGEVMFSSKDEILENYKDIWIESEERF
jgi:CRP-like cAMP-binding protein